MADARDGCEDRAEEMRVCMDARFSARVEAREGDMGIFISLGDEGSCVAVLIIVYLGGVS